MPEDNKKTPEAPAVVHGSSKEAQHNWFKDVATETGRKVRGEGMGKGSRPRTSVNNKNWQENYDEIFRKPAKDNKKLIKKKTRKFMAEQNQLPLDDGEKGIDLTRGDISRGEG